MMSNSDAQGETDDESEWDDGLNSDDHLAGVADGAGCTEIWAHLSDQRADDADGSA